MQFTRGWNKRTHFYCGNWTIKTGFPVQGFITSQILIHLSITKDPNKKSVRLIILKTRFFPAANAFIKNACENTFWPQVLILLKKKCEVINKKCQTPGLSESFYIYHFNPLLIMSTHENACVWSAVRVTQHLASCFFFSPKVTSHHHAG